MYRIFFEQFLLPSLSLLGNLASKVVDVVKVTKMPLENGFIFEGCVLIVDGIYLQKSVQYHSGYYVGEDPEGSLYKGVVVYLIVSLINYVPCAIKALLRTSRSGYWLSDEIDKSIINLEKISLQVRAGALDDLASNVNVFSILLNKCGGDHNLFIYHPAYGDQLKTYLLFDIFHLTKNFRNNLLNRTKFIFPEYYFDLFDDPIVEPIGNIS